MNLKMKNTHKKNLNCIKTQLSRDVILHIEKRNEKII